MSLWKVELTATARRELRLPDEGPQRDATELMQDLAGEGPFIVPSLQMRGLPDTWRARFHHDRYRMVYQVSRKRRQILVTRIRLRPTACEGMKD